MMPGQTEPTRYLVEFQRVVADWDRITNAVNPVPLWETELIRMQSEVAASRARGDWRSGGRTLLRALGVHHNEVLMCSGLAWLLAPDGWHGLGSAFLDGLLAHLGISADGSEHAVVATEEARADTRADVIVRLPGTTLLIEAKIWASEQARQADRLADNWDDEPLALVFLTRDAATPTTAVSSAGRWSPLAWSDLATILSAAVEERPACEPGVHEYLRTLEVYGGSRQ